jgi:hypothetical protein
LVPDFLPLESQRVALIHEIAHALADQRFDVRQFLAPPTLPLDGDATRARLAIVEGDATLAALEVIDPAGGFLRPTALADLVDRLRAAAGEHRAPWLSELTRFVHVDGFLFVAQVRAQRPWSAIDALWRDPPASSEQVLHREKYEACEAPIAVSEAALPALPGFDGPRTTDVLGEVVIRAWLSTALPAEIAARAAAGWGGDRAAIYRAGDRGAAARGPAAPRPDGGAALAAPEPPPLAWITIWDDAGEADDFARAAAVVPGAAVQRRNEAVAIFLGAPDLAPAALDGMLDGSRPAIKPAKDRVGHRQAMPGGTLRGGVGGPSQGPPEEKGARPRRAAQPDCRRRDRAAAPR